MSSVTSSPSARLFVQILTVMCGVLVGSGLAVLALAFL